MTIDTTDPRAPIYAHIDTFVIDFQGHDRTGTVGAQSVVSHGPDIQRSMHETFTIPVMIQTLIAEKGIEMSEDPQFAEIQSRAAEPITRRCYTCGSKFRLDATSPTQFVASSVCPYPQGIPTYTVDIDVPSGRMVVANDLRNLVGLQTVNDNYDVNYPLESVRCSQDYGRAGMLHVCVGNSNPQISTSLSGVLTIGTPSRNATRHGYVNTRLWWVSMMDYDYFVARMDQHAQARGVPPASPEAHLAAVDGCVVDVPKGLWSFTIDPEVDRDARTVVYAQGKRSGPVSGWVPEADPYADPQTLESSHFWAAWTHWIQGPYAWPFWRWITHNFCVLGSGRGWTQGRLCSRQQDTPFAMVKTPDGGQGLDPTWPLRLAAIHQAHPGVSFALPTFPAAMTDSVPDGRVYPMNTYIMPLAAQAPESIDIYWLAIALMLFQTLHQTPRLLSSDASDAPQQGIVDTTLDVLKAIATQRGLWPRLPQVFAELQAALPHLA